VHAFDFWFSLFLDLQFNTDIHAFRSDLRTFTRLKQVQIVKA